jgi:predicted transcriptional regulator
MRSLADTLRRAIKESGMTPTELARRAGVPQPCVSKFLRRKQDLNLETVEKICRVLGLDMKKADHQGNGGRPLA